MMKNYILINFHFITKYLKFLTSSSLNFVCTNHVMGVGGGGYRKQSVILDLFLLFKILILSLNKNRQISGIHFSIQSLPIDKSKS
jgi:hypothetical protein